MLCIMLALASMGQTRVTLEEYRMLRHIVAHTASMEHETARMAFTGLDHAGRQAYYREMAALHGMPSVDRSIPVRHSSTTARQDQRAPRQIRPVVMSYQRPRMSRMLGTPLYFLQGNIGGVNCGPSG